MRLYAAVTELKISAKNYCFQLYVKGAMKIEEKQMLITSQKAIEGSYMTIEVGMVIILGVKR